ncbi:uncharacterized protein [Amphiura filiformis]|uniref:uncharacterized protein isoform X1 n=1 Tax=Amphiura filiformis TaxID=82378 RepID=UPI003B227386
MAKMPTKMMQKIMRTTPLDVVIMTQKDYMDSFKNVQGKIDTVSKALLKWSYIEPNPSIAQAFSCWADLDYAYGQLILQVCEKGVQYRQVFKDIRDQGVEWSKVKQDKKNAANDVASALRKVENLRKSKKVDQPKIDSAEAELQLAKTRDEEMTEVLTVKTQEFEEYKAKSIRDALLTYSNNYLDAISTMQMIFQTKKEIGEMMSETPVYAGQELPNGHPKVEPIFEKLDLELPMRDAALDRHQINRTVSAPPMRKASPSTQPKMSNLHSMQEHITKHFPDTARIDETGRPASTVVYKTDFSDSDDDDCYEYPEDPVPVANKSATLPANILHQQQAPKLPAPNLFAKPDPTKQGPRLPPNAVQLVSMPPKLPPHVPMRALSNDNDVSDGEDDHEYQYPEESFGSSNPSINTAEEEEEYIVPNHQPSEASAAPKTTKSEKIENPEHMNTPGAVYFEVEDKNPDRTRLPPGISTPDFCPVNHPSLLKKHVATIIMEILARKKPLNSD